MAAWMTPTRSVMPNMRVRYSRFVTVTSFAPPPSTFVPLTTMVGGATVEMAAPAIMEMTANGPTLRCGDVPKMK